MGTGPKEQGGEVRVHGDDYVGSAHAAEGILQVVIGVKLGNMGRVGNTGHTNISPFFHFSSDFDI